MGRPFEFHREAALKKAILLFWSKGYFNTSFNDIVSHMALNRSSIYNSFSDKRTLFIESLKYYIEKESVALTMSLEKIPPTDKGIKAILESATKNPHGCLVVNSATELGATDNEIKQLIQDNVTSVIAAFAGFFKAGQEQGYFTDKITASELAMLLFHQITSLRVTSKVLTNKSLANNSIKSFIQLIKKS
jgi:TetR/AcrR family transcriptional regulator, transcriptional repressor for nem operon